MINVKVGDKMIFLSAWPFGKLYEVEILGKKENMPNGWYFRYPHGGTDCTDTDFLFELPEKPGECPMSDIQRYGITSSYICSSKSGNLVMYQDHIKAIEAKSLKYLKLVDKYSDLFGKIEGKNAEIAEQDRGIENLKGQYKTLEHGFDKALEKIDYLKSQNERLKLSLDIRGLKWIYGDKLKITDNTRNYYEIGEIVVVVSPEYVDSPTYVVKNKDDKFFRIYEDEAEFYEQGTLEDTII